MTYATGKESWGICARCALKVPYRSLVADGNSPGLRVCGPPTNAQAHTGGCWDGYDPWRLAPPPPDPQALQYPRPDQDIGVPAPPYIDTETYIPIGTNDGDWILWT
jgi:hypothetical protein